MTNIFVGRLAVLRLCYSSGGVRISCLAYRACVFGGQLISSSKVGAISATYLAGRKGWPTLMCNPGDDFEPDVHRRLALKLTLATLPGRHLSHPAQRSPCPLCLAVTLATLLGGHLGHPAQRPPWPPCRAITLATPLDCHLGHFVWPSSRRPSWRAIVIVILAVILACHLSGYLDSHLGGHPSRPSWRPSRRSS